jgi:peptidoglycan/xylan/chitin deacetylase (PgdA/CDA1 family)
MARFAEAGPGRREEFLAKGGRGRHYFPHRVYRLPKCAPDGFKVGRRMCGRADLTTHWQVLLYADPRAIEDLPAELFRDDDLMWHRQQYGRPGQLATAALIVDGDEAWSYVHHSDLVQRIGRRREFKTHVEKRFKGWPSMLLNGVMTFALERGARRLRVPTSELALEHTDPRRDVQAPLFERVYDAPMERLGARRDGRWWLIELDPERIMGYEFRDEPDWDGRAICVGHDLEAGHGHRDYDAALAAQADSEAAARLDEMLAVEERAGLAATYNVVGLMWNDVAGRVHAAGHCVAFHSYDHRTEENGQLARCRELDYRAKGYRPPRSEITHELEGDELAFHNFEWLASSESSFGRDTPALERGLVRLPVSVDDFALFMDGEDYSAWERALLARAARDDYTCVMLHDCYADHWLPRYGALLEKLSAIGPPLRTLDELAGEVAMAHAV